MWAEFHAHYATLGAESEQLLHALFTSDNDREVDFLQRDKVKLEQSPALIAPAGPTDSTAVVKNSPMTIMTKEARYCICPRIEIPI